MINRIPMGMLLVLGLVLGGCQQGDPALERDLEKWFRNIAQAGGAPSRESFDEWFDYLTQTRSEAQVFAAVKSIARRSEKYRLVAGLFLKLYMSETDYDAWAQKGLSLDQRDRLSKMVSEMRP